MDFGEKVKYFHLHVTNKCVLWLQLRKYYSNLCSSGENVELLTIKRKFVQRFAASLVYAAKKKRKAILE